MTPLFESLFLNKIVDLNFKKKFGLIQPPKPNRRSNINNLLASMRTMLGFIDSFFTLIPSSIRLPMSELVSNLIWIYDADPHAFCSCFKESATWFGRWVMSGSVDQGIVSDDNWDTEKRCPKILSNIWDPLIKMDQSKWSFAVSCKLILTVLNVYRNVVVAKVLDTTSITDSSNTLEFEEPKILQALLRLGITPAAFQEEFYRRIRTSQLHYTTSSGPNGQALTKCHLDAQAVIEDQTLASALHQWCMLSGQKRLWQMLINTRREAMKTGLLTRDDMKPGSTRHSKLHIIHEKGDKSRVIAIADYWTQDSMVALHDTINHFLKSKLHRDFTFNQDAGVDFVKGLTSNADQIIASLDLTAATDRLPVWFQSQILGTLLDNMLLGRVWKGVLTNRSFYLEKEKINLRYAVGQPMGIKSSFAMLALMHHVIVQISAMDSGLRSYEDYALLGDDIVMTNLSVIEHYIAYMRRIGQVIHTHKSVFAYHDIKGAEFCKRVLRNGEDWSPIPPGILMRVARSGRFGPQLQNELERRGFIVNDSWLWIFLERILKLKWLKYMLIMNGMPKGVTGLIRPVQNDRVPYCKYQNVCGLYNLSEDDWKNVSIYLDVVSAIKQHNSIIQDVYSGRFIEEVLSNAARLGFKAPYLFEQVSTTMYSSMEFGPDNILGSGEAARPYENYFKVAYPLHSRALLKVGEMHPFFNVIANHETQAIENFYQMEWGQNGLQKGAVDVEDYLTRRDYLSLYMISNINREVDDHSEGIRSIKHVSDILDTLRLWIRYPDKRTLSFSTRIPQFMNMLTVSLRQGGHLRLNVTRPYQYDQSQWEAPQTLFDLLPDRHVKRIIRKPLRNRSIS